MMPAAYYREVRSCRASLGICQKCGKSDAEFPYSCCTKCRDQQAKMDRARAKKKAQALAAPQSKPIL